MQTMFKKLHLYILYNPRILHTDLILLGVGVGVSPISFMTITPGPIKQPLRLNPLRPSDAYMRR